MNNSGNNLYSRDALLRVFDLKKDFMEDKITTGIESFRKGHAFLTIKDSNGNLLKNKKFTVKLQKHAFYHGANLFMLDELESDEKNELYKKYYAQIFNSATLPFYWCDIEPEKGKLRFAKNSPKIYRRPAPDLLLEYCQKHSITPKAHCLNYGTFTPKWVPGTVAENKRALEERFATLAEHYKDKINFWEVTNETFWDPKDPTFDNFPFYLEPDLIEWSFEMARKYFPSHKLAINESNRWIWEKTSFYFDRSPYFMQIQRALSKGAKIDSIGMQYHMFYRKEDAVNKSIPFYDPEWIYDILDTYWKLQIPIHISEVTIPAYSNSKEDEDIQAEIIKNLYRLWFSHPALEGILYWNLIDGYAYGTKQGDMSAGENYYYGGLLRYDCTPKKSYQVIQDLFTKEWTTNLEIETNNDGKAFMKGFYGDYQITSNDNKIANFTIDKSLKRNHTIIFE